MRQDPAQGQGDPGPARVDGARWRTPRPGSVLCTMDDHPDAGPSTGDRRARQPSGVG